MSVVDLTSLQTDPPPAGIRDQYKMSGGKVLRRDPSTVTGIVLHQMDTDMGVSAGQIATAGSAHEALHRRALKIASHMAVFDGRAAGVVCGDAVYANPLDWYVYHSDALNAQALGIEIEGSFPYLMWKSLASDRLIAGARAGLSFLVQRGRALGMPIRYIWAHRQADSKRGADPGEELWRRLVLEFAIPQLGLEIQPDLAFGDGKPVPALWGRRPGAPSIPTLRRAVGLGAGLVLGTVAGYVGYISYRERETLIRRLRGLRHG